MKPIRHSTWLLSLILFAALTFAFAAFSGGDRITELPELNPHSEILSQLPDRFDGKVDERGRTTLALGLEPYGTLSWPGLNGEAELGAGANVVVGITKNLALVGFGEADNTDATFVDRFGGGLRYTAFLGTKVSLDAGVAGGYDLEAVNFFLRLPLGANFYAIKTRNADLGLRIAYSFDIDGNGKTGTATGRGYLGPVFNYRF